MAKKTELTKKEQLSKLASKAKVKRTTYKGGVKVENSLTIKKTRPATSDNVKKAMIKKKTFDVTSTSKGKVITKPKQLTDETKKLLIIGGANLLDYILTMCQLKSVVSMKNEAVHSKRFEDACNLRNEELKVQSTLNKVEIKLKKSANELAKHYNVDKIWN